MSQREPCETLQKAETDPLEVWKRSIPSLRAEIRSLQALLTSLAVEETEAQEQLESLTYALGLTKGELERRRRSNNELSTAYESQCGDGYNAQFDIVQKLEGELLNAKRDSANMEYEVEHLQFRLKRLRDSGQETVSPVLSQSPRMGIRSPIGTTSPKVGQGRLIGDVDGVIRMFGSYTACRVGVSAGGSLGVYSYDASDVLLYLDEHVVFDEVCDGDLNALKELLRRVEVRCGDWYGSLVGLGEGVKASVEMMKEVCGN